LRLSSAYSTI